MELNKYIASIQDLPKKGILFRDMTPLLADGKAFTYALDELSEFAKSVKADVIVGPEARGFIFGTPIAYKLNIGFVPVRKPGKLPRETIEYNYDLEYGSNTLCIKPGEVIVYSRNHITNKLLQEYGIKTYMIPSSELSRGRGGPRCMSMPLIREE